MSGLRVQERCCSLSYRQIRFRVRVILLVNDFVFACLVVWMGLSRRVVFEDCDLCADQCDDLRNLMTWCIPFAATYLLLRYSHHNNKDDRCSADGVICCYCFLFVVLCVNFAFMLKAVIKLSKAVWAEPWVGGMPYRPPRTWTWTYDPTAMPTTYPTNFQTTSPTNSPGTLPTSYPTYATPPSSSPTRSPTSHPTPYPTQNLTSYPTVHLDCSDLYGNVQGCLIVWCVCIAVWVIGYCLWLWLFAYPRISCTDADEEGEEEACSCCCSKECLCCCSKGPNFSSGMVDEQDLVTSTPPPIIIEQSDQPANDQSYVPVAPPIVKDEQYEWVMGEGGWPVRRPFVRELEPASSGAPIHNPLFADDRAELLRPPRPRTPPKQSSLLAGGGCGDVMRL
eukprot:Hpha_TRINITY_DN13701_c0_g1::TRINITY_DN13701_c0_g1_i1::g.142521::m.142521